jgi:hypothetical protein
MTDENHDKMQEIVNRHMEPLLEEISSLATSNEDYEDIHLCVGEYLTNHFPISISWRIFK